MPVDRRRDAIKADSDVTASRFVTAWFGQPETQCRGLVMTLKPSGQRKEDVVRE